MKVCVLRIKNIYESREILGEKISIFSGEMCQFAVLCRHGNISCMIRD